jgi:hypothetical protein
MGFGDVLASVLSTCRFLGFVVGGLVLGALISLVLPFALDFLVGNVTVFFLKLFVNDLNDLRCCCCCCLV